MRYFHTLLLLLAALTTALPAQKWQPLTGNAPSGDRRIHPKKAHFATVDNDELRELLFAAPHETTVTAEESAHRVSLPLPNGDIATFRIVGYDVAAPSALAKYPGIRTWYGINTEVPTQIVFLDWTQRGFHATIRGGGTESVYIDPLSRRSTTRYQVYRKSEMGRNADDFVCMSEPGRVTGGVPEGVEASIVGDCRLMQYRTTITTTAEYSNYHGATSAAQSGLVQSAVVTSINRLNGIFTRDLSLRLQLVGNNDELYFYDANTDGLTGSSIDALLNENTPKVDGIIGSANYDYGHIYTRGPNNGLARLQASCGDSKAAGATSHTAPENDPFNIDYVAHEMGHNFGGNHTQNTNCNYSASAGMEVGSGSSIMGYAGICPPNVQGVSDDYFHGRNLEEISAHLELDGGDCGTYINTSLNNPTINNPTDETIPFGTPFVLASGGNGNGTLTYNWEQYDVEPGPMPPRGTSALGPLFRGFDPVSSDERFFPELSATIAGVTPTWEVLPQRSRNMEFLATLRNQNAAYGCASEDRVLLTVDGTNGPFLVTDPDQGNQWSAGQTAQIRWDIAGTDQAPISSGNVSVLLSTDGGLTFQTLLSSTPNDGYAEVSVPGQISASARIMVRSADNVFFNVSTQDFSIVSAAGVSSLAFRALSPVSYAGCNFNGGLTFGFLTESSGGATSPINWTVMNAPAGVTSSFSVNPTRPGGTSELTLEGLDGAPAGNYQVTLRGSSTDGTVDQVIDIDLVSGNQAGPATIAPTGADIDLRPLLIAAEVAGATYDFEVSASTSFNTILYSAQNQPASAFSLPDYLAANSEYFWRIRSNSDCGTSDWSVSSFTTGDCQLFRSTAAAVTISSGPPTQTASMTLNVPTNGTITDLDLYQVDVDHTYIGDLQITLTAPSGTSAQVFDQTCDNQNGIFASFDDESQLVDEVCPPVSGEFLLPAGGPLSVFDDLNAQGPWTLRVDDRADIDGGSLNGFAVKLCLTATSLPVDWLSFTATGQKDHIALAWETINETDNLGFFVERQTADGLNWRGLGFVAAGNRYVFDDHSAAPATDHIYRLRQQDVDGRVSYSELRSARLDGTGNGLALYPNPTSGALHYSLTGERKELPYQLLDVSGRVLESGMLKAVGTLDISERAAGIYFLRLEEQTRKVVRM